MAVRGSFLGLKIRQARKAERGLFVMEKKRKPAKIRHQTLRITKEFPQNPHKKIVYQINVREEEKQMVFEK